MSAAGIDALAASPIGRWLDASVGEDEAGALYRLPFHERHIGNTAIRALHGGVVAAFLEFAALCTLMSTSESDAQPATVNGDTDYLRSAKAKDLFARTRILRLGRRIAVIEAAAWQDDEATPVAVARFRIRPPRQVWGEHPTPLIPAKAGTSVGMPLPNVEDPGQRACLPKSEISRHAASGMSGLWRCRNKPNAPSSPHPHRP